MATSTRQQDCTEARGVPATIAARQDGVAEVRYEAPDRTTARATEVVVRMERDADAVDVTEMVAAVENHTGWVHNRTWINDSIAGPFAVFTFTVPWWGQ